MKIETAIEELTQLHKVGLNRLTPNEKGALQLGIEALKRIQEERNPTDSTTTMRLPGETKE